jgi:hypothetical protein
MLDHPCAHVATIVRDHGLANAKNLALLESRKLHYVMPTANRSVTAGLPHSPTLMGYVALAEPAWRCERRETLKRQAEKPDAWATRTAEPTDVWGEFVKQIQQS